MLLYYITDRTAFSGSEAERRSALLRRIGEAACAGVDYIQLREKDLCTRELERLAHEALAALRESSATTKLLINGRTDIALAVGADGVHLPGGEIPPSEVRTLWMKCSDRAPIIGVSAHSLAEVRLAESHGADFAVLAPIFEKPHTAARAIGVAALREACSRLPACGAESSSPAFPVLALGGVNVENAAACVSAGAFGVAGIRVFQTGEVQETVQRLRALSSQNALSARRF